MKMKKLDLNLCPISDEQLQETFIKIIEQLTELQFDYKHEYIDEIIIDVISFMVNKKH